ncbi:MAG: hypothetical protein ABL958_07885 [Bdellovibrionia bacterium]
MNQRSAIAKINKRGMLLVFPINNKKEPASLWSEFYPKAKMRWEWDSDGDNRVASLWHLMKRLSGMKDVVYSKWFQGRATFFSRELFLALLADRIRVEDPRAKLSRNAREILETLENDSPLSTKQLKKMTELQGRDNEPAYNRAMKELFSTFLIVGFGEVEDGAFPSLAVGATKLIYEDLWVESRSLDKGAAQETIDRFLPGAGAAGRFLKKQPTLLFSDDRHSLR